MINFKHFLVVIIVLVFFSCSKKITTDNLNKPIYKDLKKYSKKSYKEYGGLAKFSFSEFYENAKYAEDFRVNYRNKVIDSIKLFEQKDWIIIEISFTGYAGFYNRTFIFKGEECISYLLRIDDAIDKKEKLDLTIRNIDELEKHYEKNIYNLYCIVNNEVCSNTIDLTPSEHYPIDNYYISVCKDDKLKFYKTNSTDYVLKKWK